jgi:CRISP-associated protein Cas1
VHEPDGVVAVPCASLTTILLGPGTTITHAAVRALVESGCVIVWAGEQGVRCYARGTGETRSARNQYRQARAWADAPTHLAVVRRLYALRFREPIEDSLTLQQIRGHEGARVRAAYATASREHAVPWEGRSYARGDWSSADVVNRALSAANSCLYGISHAALVSAGYSPALGFIHVGKQLSFVYDVADLYKAELTIPLAFRMAADGAMGLEGRVRRALRDEIASRGLLGRILQDVDRVLDPAGLPLPESVFDADDAAPGGLWQPDGDEVPGGMNWAEQE